MKIETYADLRSVVDDDVIEVSEKLSPRELEKLVKQQIRARSPGESRSSRRNTLNELKRVFTRKTPIRR